MRCLRASPSLSILLVVLAGVISLITMWWGIPRLWPYREHPLVRFLLVFLSGGHLEGLYQETGVLL